jgi:hypothetical protein
MFCPEAPGAPDGDWDPIRGGGFGSLLRARSIHVEVLGLPGGPDCVHGGLGSTHGSLDLLVKSFSTRLEIIVWVLCFDTTVRGTPVLW